MKAPENGRSRQSGNVTIDSNRRYDVDSRWTKTWYVQATGHKTAVKQNLLFKKLES